MPESGYKRCARCGEEKPVEEFYGDRRAADGLSSDCKPCRRSYQRQWRLKRPKREAERRLRQLQRTPERVRESRRAYKRRNREKISAHNAIYQALLRGKLVRPNACERCGAEERHIQAHHPDYSRKLDVNWLCAGCHAAEHLTDKRRGSSDAS